MLARAPKQAVLFLLGGWLLVPPIDAQEVAKANLAILGVSLEVDRKPVATGTDIPTAVQTTHSDVDTQVGVDQPIAHADEPRPGM
jgi:hypothetical protein